MSKENFMATTTTTPFTLPQLEEERSYQQNNPLSLSLSLSLKNNQIGYNRAT
jgi:hypothetical protein